MLLRHKIGLMGMARNLCSLQKCLFCLHQLIGGGGGLSLYSLRLPLVSFLYTHRIDLPFVYLWKKPTLRYTVSLVAHFNLLEH